MRPHTHSGGPLAWGLLAVPVLWLAALLATGYEDGMTAFDLIGRFSDLLERPFAIRWTSHTPQFLLGSLVLYAFAVTLYLSTKQNRRPGEEHGSAKWGDARQLDCKYRDKKPENNVILTQHLHMSLNSRQHQRNLLQIVVGGSGSGKTRYVVKPNVYLANASYICTDPKGELARSTIPLLLRKGYVVKVFDLVDLERSDCYNPFHYIRSDADVLKLISNFIRNTTPKNAHSNDPFWEKSETALDCALMLYLLHEAPPEEQTMEMMLTMLEYGAAKEGDGDYQSPLDLLFEGLAEENPDHIALRQYRVFKQAPSETAMSILITAAVRLAPFTLPEVQRITAADSMELEKLGERKQAIFCIIPDSNDVSLNFLVGMLYTQAFQELYYQADKVHGGSLPIPVRLMFDEFANGATRSQLKRLGVKLKSNKEKNGKELCISISFIELIFRQVE